MGNNNIHQDCKGREIVLYTGLDHLSSSILSKLYEKIVELGGETTIPSNPNLAIEYLQDLSEKIDKLNFNVSPIITHQE